MPYRNDRNATTRSNLLYGPLSRAVDFTSDLAAKRREEKRQQALKEALSEREDVKSTEKTALEDKRAAATRKWQYLGKLAQNPNLEKDSKKLVNQKLLEFATNPEIDLGGIETQEQMFKTPDIWREALGGTVPE